MHIPDHNARVELSDPNRAALGPTELAFVDATLSQAAPSENEEQAPMAAIGAWNRAFRGGFDRQLDGAALVERCVPSINVWRNPNLVLVPACRGFSELHTLLTELLPDERLARLGIRRRSSNFALWPLTLPCPERSLEALATSIESEFSDFLWSKLVSRHRREDFAPDAAVRVLVDDSRFWMSLLYGVATRRAEEAASNLAPPGWLRGMLSAGGDSGLPPPIAIDRTGLTMRNSQGETVRLEIPPMPLSPTYRTVDFHDGRGPVWIQSGALVDALPAGPLWDASDPAARSGVVDELLELPEARARRELGSLLVKDALLGEAADGHRSRLAIDLTRKHNRTRVKGRRLEFRATLDDRPAYSGSAAYCEGDSVLRTIELVATPRERGIIALLRFGRTRNEIASDMRMHRTEVSRAVRRVERAVRRLLDAGL